MRIPPDERRSPSSRDIRTSTRSCSILIGNRSPTKHSLMGLAPSELVTSFSIDAEMVADLVDPGDGALARDFFLVVALAQDRQPVDRNRVGQREGVVRQPVGERGTP